MCKKDYKIEKVLLCECDKNKMKLMKIESKQDECKLYKIYQFSKQLDEKYDSSDEKDREEVKVTKKYIYNPKNRHTHVEHHSDEWK